MLHSQTTVHKHILRALSYVAGMISLFAITQQALTASDIEARLDAIFPVDSDVDGVLDHLDNCPDYYNYGQYDEDSDGEEFVGPC